MVLVVFALLTACNKGAAPAVAADGEIGCNRNGMLSPNIVPEELLGERWGAGVEKFSELNSTKEQPVEVCGAMEQVRALMNTTCDDGSNPFSDGTAAHAARAGNVGPGGRCDTIIDLYIVPCPEAKYQVFMDLYSCPPGGSPY